MVDELDVDGIAVRRQPPMAARASGTTMVTGVITVAGLVLVAVVWRSRPVVAAVLAAFALVLGVLSQVDLRERRLPNRIVGPLAAATTAWVVGYGLVDGDGRRVGWAVVAGVVGSLALLLLSLAGPLGMGDIKLAFPIGMLAGWLGADAVRATIGVTAISGALVAGALLVAGRGRRHTLPYGPFMALGSLAGILLAARS